MIWIINHSIQPQKHGRYQREKIHGRLQHMKTTQKSAVCGSQLTVCWTPPPLNYNYTNHYMKAKIAQYNTKSIMKHLLRLFPIIFDIRGHKGPAIQQIVLVTVIHGKRVHIVFFDIFFNFLFLNQHFLGYKSSTKWHYFYHLINKAISFLPI